VALGVDDAIDSNTRLGFAVAYSQMSVGGNNNQDIRVDNYQAALYTQSDLDDGKYTSAKLTFGWNQNDTTHFTGEDTAKINYDSWYGNVDMELGKVFNYSDNLSITPSIGVNYLYMKEDAYSEDTVSPLALTVKGHSDDSLIMRVGVKAAYRLEDEDGTKRELTGHVSVGYDALADQDKIDASIGGVDVTALGEKSKKVVIKAGVGMNFMSQGPWSASVNYDAASREQYVDQQVSATVRYKW
jgi:outer membrane autotransporter protein